MGSGPLSAQMASLTENDILVFVHIPKTAGSTFKGILGRQFPPGRIRAIFSAYQGSIDQIKSLSAQDKAHILCLSGHVPFGIHRYFSQRKVHYVSFVRDPVDRTLSEYSFLTKHPQLMPLIGLDVGMTLSPQVFLEHQKSIGMLDFQTRALSGYDDFVESVLPPYRKMSVEDPDSLIRSIDDSFALIGTVEHFDESLLLMKREFGWRKTCYISRNVARTSEKRLELKKALGEEIRKLNPMDCKLHTYFKKKIEARIVDQGEGFARELRRFRLLNRLYSQAWQVYRATGLRRLRRVVAKIQAAAAKS